MAGAIPIMDYQPWLEELRSELPVVTVTDWSQVTPKWLNAKYAEVQQKAADGIYNLAKVCLHFMCAGCSARHDPLTHPN